MTVSASLLANELVQILSWRRKAHRGRLAPKRLAGALIGRPVELNIDLFFGDRIGQTDPIERVDFVFGFHGSGGCCFSLYRRSVLALSFR
jgi:hypothetical protein